MTKRMICTFAAAHTNIEIYPFNNAGRTVRVVIPNNINGDALLIKFGNYYGDTPCVIQNATVCAYKAQKDITENMFVPITVNGESCFSVPCGAEILSDEIPLSVSAGDSIAVSLYYPNEEKPVSGNFLANFATRSQKGDYTHCPDMPCPKLWTKLSHTLMPWDASSAVTTLREVTVVQNKPETAAPQVIAILGDSIEQQGAWTTPFTEKLYNALPGAVSFCNLGIGGNRFLHPSPKRLHENYGISGKERYRRDILAIKGLTHVIFALGTNDIGLPGKDGVPETEQITAAQYREELCKTVAEFKNYGLKVYAATLLPRNINSSFDIKKEQLRREINDFIRTADIFDGILDFDLFMHDENGAVPEHYFLPDGLHPSIEGGKNLSDKTDINIFNINLQ